jgi:hypothetical protein
MTTSTDHKQESQGANPMDYVETIISSTSDADMETLSPYQTRPDNEFGLSARPRTTSADTEMPTDGNDYLWEQEINLLAATETYSPWISLDQILLLEEIRPYVSDDVYQQILIQADSTDDTHFSTDELWSRIAIMPEDISHELFEVMSSLDLS